MKLVSLPHPLSLLLLVIALFLQFPASAQVTPPSDSLQPVTRNEFEDLNRNNQRYRDILEYTGPILYISLFPQVDPINPRPRGLVNGEGKNGYWMEANFSSRINLYTGKYYSPAVFRPLRFTLDAAFTVRGTQDDSYPLLPSNNRFGLGVDYLLTPLRNFESHRPAIWLTAQLHHYSNGQSESFYISDSVRRNNYRSGDFSTNYLRGLINIGKFTANDRYLVSGKLGYQRDFNLVGPLDFTPELNNNYGRNRLLLEFQILQTSRYKLTRTGKKTTAFERRSGWRYRGQADYILDKNLSAFPLDQKFRFGLHNFLTWSPFVTSDVGFFFHDYIGRDYLNIRFDDIIHTYQLGIMVNLYHSDND